MQITNTNRWASIINSTVSCRTYVHCKIDCSCTTNLRWNDQHQNTWNSASGTYGCSSFSTSAEKELAEIHPDKILHAPSFCLLTTFSYCLCALTDQWPVNSWISFSVVSDWKSVVAPDALRPWLMNFPSILVCSHIIFITSDSACFPHGCSE